MNTLRNVAISILRLLGEDNITTLYQRLVAQPTLALGALGIVAPA
jgi:hypothetical protein